jgi:hypothetical protein
MSEEAWKKAQIWPPGLAMTMSQDSQRKTQQGGGGSGQDQ